MKIILEDYEKLHDLQVEGLKLVQNKNGFSYGTDAVLLSNFIRLKKGDTVLDFCSGSGIIPVLLSAQGKAKKIVGLEIEQEIADTSLKTVAINNLEGKVEFICGDIKRASKIFDYSFDVVTCNPPYSKNGSGKVSDKDKIALARYELACTIDDVAKNAAKVMKYGGRFYLIHKSERLADIIVACRKYRLEPKEMQFVYTRAGKDASFVMMCAVLGGGVQVNVLPPLIIN
ncbi:MAG: tRNA1(Val) (adenine(37)-N6)-methyltransferase [Bacillota bacterium]|nr:tRNA1(Val) (adenine(37)-N6)-methyltransferase [Bacillota bacterium]